MAASYPSSAKSFTSKTDGVDTNAAGDINALQDEVTAVETGLLSGFGHDVKFSPDATFDIGKSGATRPRDGFFSRNVTVGGTLTPVGLIDASGAAAGQIKFPAAQNVSADANTLDDYEEGTWAPTVGGSATYTAQTGSYTKIGRHVYIEGHVTINVLGTGSVSQMTGAPFSAPNIMSGTVGFFAGSATNFTYVSCYINGTTIVITAIGAAGAGMTNGATFFGNGADIYFAIDYHV